MISNLLQTKELPNLQYSLVSDRFDETWEAPLSILLGLGRAAGADFVEFFLERNNYISCLAEDDTITSISPRLSTGAGIRAFKGKADCYVSTNNLTFLGLKSALERALSILGLQLPSQSSIIPSIHLELFRDYATKKNKESWIAQCSPMREMGDILLGTNQMLAKKGKHIQSRRSGYFRDWQEILVAASDGTFARDIRLTQSIGSNLLCADGANRSSIGKRVGGTSDPSYLRNWNYEPVVDEIIEAAGKMLYADYVESGSYPIIMANQFGGVIFHEACGHLLETTGIEAKTTPFAEMKGQKIAHENLTAWDEGRSEEAFGTIDMDDEGMPTQRTLLIENGILKIFISDRAGELRTSVDKGIYCKKMGGGSVLPTGQFNFAVDEAYLIENGKITKPLKGATLIGDAKEIMQEISMSSRDLELAAGFCGSISGSVYVTVGQPHIKVDAITVGGR